MSGIYVFNPEERIEAIKMLKTIVIINAVVVTENDVSRLGGVFGTSEKEARQTAEIAWELLKRFGYDWDRI